jgi:hypothetical protein
MKFKPSNYFYETVSVLKDSLLFRKINYLTPIWFSSLLWIVFPLIPLIILSWYIADIAILNTVTYDE